MSVSVSSSTALIEGKRPSLGNLINICRRFVDYLMNCSLFSGSTSFRRISIAGLLNDLKLKVRLELVIELGNYLSKFGRRL